MKKIIVLTITLLCLAAVTNAQVEEGDQEIRMAGTITSFEGVTIALIAINYGYFLTEKTEIGGGPIITYLGSDYFDMTNISLTFFGRHNFVTGEKLVPYIGGQIYQYDLSPDEPFSFTDFTFLQVGGGFKYFIRENIAYDVSGNLGIGLGGGDVVMLIYGGISAFF